MESWLLFDGLEVGDRIVVFWKVPVPIEQNGERGMTFSSAPFVYKNHNDQALLAQIEDKEIVIPKECIQYVLRDAKVTLAPTGIIS